MTARAKPGSVIAVLVLLILIAVYQLLMGPLALLGGLLVESTDLLAQIPEAPEATEIPIWAVFTGAAIAIVYGLATVVLAVLVGKGNPTGRPAALAVNGLYGVVILALVFTPVAGAMDVIAALFAFTVVALLYSKGARAYFGAAPAVEEPARG